MTEDNRFTKIDLNSPVPRYFQIRQNILDLIQSNVLRAGDGLPSERELSEAFGVSRMTVRQAINELENQGVVRRVQGVGTFVAEVSNITPLSPAVVGFSERFSSAGMKPTSQVITLDVTLATPTVAERLALAPKDPVIFLKRLRLVNDEPLMVEKSYLSYQQYPELVKQDFSTQSLYSELERHYQTHIVETEQTLEPTLLTPEESEYFGLKAGQPAMLVHITAYTNNRQPVEFCKSVIRGDRCRYFFVVNSQTPIVFR